jgi:hypothetical protein
MMPEEAYTNDDGCGGENQFTGLRADPGCQVLRSKFGVIRAKREQWPDETCGPRDNHVSSRDSKSRKRKRLQLARHHFPRCAFYIGVDGYATTSLLFADSQYGVGFDLAPQSNRPVPGKRRNRTSGFCRIPLSGYATYQLATTEGMRRANWNPSSKDLNRDEFAIVVFAGCRMERNFGLAAL